VDQFPIMITVAFVLGFGVRFVVGLPPLVGFLLAGFGLNLAGYVSTPDLEDAAELGVTILLFSIGLKLRVGTLSSDCSFSRSPSKLSGHSTSGPRLWWRLP